MNGQEKKKKLKHYKIRFKRQVLRRYVALGCDEKALKETFAEYEDGNIKNTQ